MIYGLADEHTHPPLLFDSLEDFRRVVVGPWNPADPRMIALGTQARVRIGDCCWSWAAFVSVPGLGRLCCPAFHEDIDVLELGRGRPSAHILPQHSYKPLDSAEHLRVRLLTNELDWSLPPMIHLWAIVSARAGKLYCPECNVTWSLRAALRLQARRRRQDSVRRNFS